VNRRLILTRIVQAFSITGLGFVAYPFIRAFVPTLREDLSLDIDVSNLAIGQSKTITWLGRNLFVTRRSEETSDNLFQTETRLKDPASQDSDQPVFARNPWRSKQPDIFIVYKNCTHLGCEVAIQPKGVKAGFECPCHNSLFDSSGRVHEESVASFNLEVPDYQYISKNRIRLMKG